MSHLGELMVKVHNWKKGVANHKKSLAKTEKPLRAGVLSAAAINWTAFFEPVESHPDVVLTAVAARSISKAEAQIAKYGLKDVKAFGSYEDLLADPEIDIVYSGVPNAMHAALACKAMRAGKHVLMEKPLASNAEDLKMIKECAKETGKVVLEAMHWRFFPATHVARAEIQSGKYGKMLSYEGTFVLPSGVFSSEDIRLQYDLAGGCLMDFCYLISTSCYFADPDRKMSVTVDEAKPRICKTDPKIDEAIDATFTLRNPDNQDGIKCTIHGDLVQAKMLGLIPKYWEATPHCTIQLEKAQIHFDNFVGPYLNHSINITMKDESGKLTGETKKIQCFKGGDHWGDRGEDWWTTYRWELEAFVDAVRQADSGAKPSPQCWVSLDETERMMSVIDAIYEKAGLPKRVSKGL